MSPAFDLLFIGGGLTLPVAAWLLWNPASAGAAIGLSIPALLLLVNQAHFAASSYRLYTAPGAFQRWPFLTMGFPLLSFVVLSLVILFVSGLGQHLWALAMTWSPYHYSAQAFGLASMYCHRSGCPLLDGERRLLRWACLMPFFRSLLGGAPSGYGLGWLVSPEWIHSEPAARAALAWGIQGLDVLVFAMPVVVWLAVRRRNRQLELLAPPGSSASRRGLPWISLSVVVTNGIWFVFFDYYHAFVWATVFHGLQYLAIVTIFHVRDRLAVPDQRHGWAYHTLVLYGVCVAVGYALFQLWPRAYMLAGFGMVESTLMVIAVINVHHFIVDAFIWRIRRDPNYGTVMATA